LVVVFFSGVSVHILVHVVQPLCFVRGQDVGIVSKLVGARALDARLHLRRVVHASSTFKDFFLVVF
jgi:hypothetical protein